MTSDTVAVLAVAWALPTAEGKAAGVQTATVNQWNKPTDAVPGNWQDFSILESAK